MAFGVVWSFVFNTLSMVVLRFKKPGLAQQNDVAAAGDDRQQLQAGDHVQQTVISAYFACGRRNQSGSTPSSATRLRNAIRADDRSVDRTDRIKNPTKTTNALSHEQQPSGPSIFIARPPIQLSW